MRKALMPACLLAAGLLVPSVSRADDAIPLRIISKSLQNPTSSGLPFKTALEDPPGYALSLRNDSDKVITAWKLSCVNAENDGNFSVAGLEQDSFFQYEEGVRSATSQNAPIYPGDVRDLFIPKDDGVGAGPYAAISCRVDATIFADRSHAGLPGAVNQLFDHRARLAADAQRTIGLLSQMKEGRRLPEGATDDNSYGDVARGADLRVKADGTGGLDELLASMREEYARIEKHLAKP